MSECLASRFLEHELVVSARHDITSLDAVFRELQSRVG